MRRPATCSPNFAAANGPHWTWGCCMPCHNRRAGVAPARKLRGLGSLGQVANLPRVLAAALVLVVAPSVPAAVVYKKGATQPIAGHLVREDDREIVLRQSRADGRTEDLVI